MTLAALRVLKAGRAVHSESSDLGIPPAETTAFADLQRATGLYLGTLGLRRKE